MARTATIVRETSESHRSTLKLNLDGTGKTDIDTSVPFSNHMMTALDGIPLIDLKIKATGDTDHAHHTVEDIGHRVRRGSEAGLGDKRGIRRFADATVLPTRHCQSRRRHFRPPVLRAPESRKASNTA